jgi:hypothetical protein
MLIMNNSGESIATINVIEIGKTTPFMIHKSFLIYHSKFFAAAFQGKYQEAQTSTMDLNDVSSATFDIFVSWVYSQQITTALGDIPSFTDLISLWIFADMIQVPRLQNQVLLAMDLRPGQLTDDTDVNFNMVYENTMFGSPLRAYIVDVVSKSKLCGPQAIDEPEAYPRDMLVDMLNWVGKNKRDKNSKFAKVDLESFLVDEIEVIHPLGPTAWFQLIQAQGHSSLREVGSLSGKVIIDLETPPQSPSRSASCVSPGDIAVER